MSRWNYVSRKRLVEPRQKQIDREQERLQALYDIIKEKKQVHVFILRKAAGLGRGAFERTFRELKTLYNDELEWNPKTQMVSFKDAQITDFEVKTDWESEL